VRIATLKPSPTSPITFSLGTTTPSKTGWPVGEPFMPILCSSRSILKPGRSLSTMNAVIPRCPADGSVTAKTT
jgi:hypothetical protein